MEVRIQITDQIWDWGTDQIWDRVGAQIYLRMAAFRPHVWVQIGNQVCGQLGEMQLEVAKAEEGGVMAKDAAEEVPPVKLLTDAELKEEAKKRREEGRAWVKANIWKYIKVKPKNED